VDISDDIITIL